MNSPLLNVGRRYLLRHPWQTVLMILGIALGVAVVVAIDLANSAAGRAFDLSTDAIAGRATHQIVGGPSGLDEAVYARLRTVGDVGVAAPVLNDFVASPELGGRPIQLLGVDPFAEAPFRSYLAESPTPTGAAPFESLVGFLTQPGALLISEALAAEHGLSAGDALTLNASGRETRGFVAGLLRPSDSLTRRALDGLVLADVATAQEITGRAGRLDRIDLILPDNDQAAVEAIAARLPQNAQIVPAGARAGAVAQMTAAFRTNLTALSLLALVVGMFLIYNSMTFSVVQRRAMFGTLRCLGVTRGEIAGMVLIEAAIVGAIGSALGLALGVLLGQGAVRLVTQTINDLYYVVNVRGVALSLPSLAKGAALGVGATVLSAVLPAWEAASVPARQALSRSGLEERARQAIPLAAVAGAAAGAIGAALLAVPSRSLTVSFAGIFLVTIGLALLAPIATLVLLRIVSPATGLLGVLGRMAPRSLVGALSRTVVAIAALSLAVSVTIGVGLMVDSFRGTVVAWLGQTLWGDVYISAPSLSATRSTAALDPRVVEIADGWPGVARVDVLRSVEVGSPDGPVAVAAVSDEDFTAPRIFVSAEGGRAGAALAVRNGAVLASEPLANRLGLPPTGGSVTLFTDRGIAAFPVAGIYRDYSSSQGTVMMGLDLYRRHWDDPEVSAAALALAPGADVDAVVGELNGALAGVQGVLVRPNEALRAEALAVFDRAFAITGALQLLAAAVAFIGILSALLALQLERGREFGVLRAVGLTRRQLRGLMLLETGLMGAVAGLLALPTGLILALILIYIINRRSFGWTLQFDAQPEVFLQAMLLAVGAAVLAGIYPAIRLAQMQAADALRSE